MFFSLYTLVFIYLFFFFQDSQVDQPYWLMGLPDKTSEKKKKKKKKMQNIQMDGRSIIIAPF